jgi:hypothetical protein
MVLSTFLLISLESSSDNILVNSASASMLWNADTSCANSGVHVARKVPAVIEFKFDSIGFNQGNSKQKLGIFFFGVINH